MLESAFGIRFIFASTRPGGPINCATLTDASHTTPASHFFRGSHRKRRCSSCGDSYYSNSIPGEQGRGVDFFILLNYRLFRAFEGLHGSRFGPNGYARGDGPGLLAQPEFFDRMIPCALDRSDVAGEAIEGSRLRAERITEDFVSVAERFRFVPAGSGEAPQGICDFFHPVRLDGAAGLILREEIGAELCEPVRVFARDEDASLGGGG